MLGVFTIALFAHAGIACPAVARADSMLLSPGQSTTRVIRACDPHNHTGIWLVKGASYTFHATGTWKDASIASGPDGYTPSHAPWYSSWIMFLAQPARRAHARWFELVGEVPAESGHYVRIGRGSDTPWTASDGGELGAFANDVSFMYDNNTDSVTLTVTRVR